MMKAIINVEIVPVLPYWALAIESDLGTEQINWLAAFANGASTAIAMIATISPTTDK